MLEELRVGVPLEQLLIDEALQSNGFDHAQSLPSNWCLDVCAGPLHGASQPRWRSQFNAALVDHDQPSSRVNDRQEPRPFGASRGLTIDVAIPVRGSALPDAPWTP